MAYRHVLVTHDYRRKLRALPPQPEFARVVVQDLPLGPEPRQRVVTLAPSVQDGSRLMRWDGAAPAATPGH